MSADLIDQVKALDQEQRAELAELLSPHVSIGRRSFLGLAGVAGGAAMVPNAARAATREAVEPAAAADGVLSDIDVLESGDDTPIGVNSPFTLADWLAFNHVSISSSTTVQDANVIYYDPSVAGFTITIGSQLEQLGLPVILREIGGSSNTVTVDTESGNGIDGGTSISLQQPRARTVLDFDSGEWQSDFFTERVNARTITTDQVDNDDYHEKVVTQSGSTGDIDLSDANVFEQTVTGDISFSFNNANSSPDGNSFLLVVIQDGTGGHSLTWPSSVEWDGGSAPGVSTDADDKHIFSFVSPDGGTTWYGFVAAENVA